MNTVSVVIPTYNRINSISRAIDSVLKQTHPINQIIVVDKNSTDIDRLNRLVLDIYRQIGKSSSKNNVIISQKK